MLFFRQRQCHVIQQEVVDQLTLSLADLQTKYRATIGFKTGVMVKHFREVEVPWIWFLRLLCHRMWPIMPEPQLRIKNASSTDWYISLSFYFYEWTDLSIIFLIVDLWLAKYMFAMFKILWENAKIKLFKFC
jgi:hypothetical protein